MEKNIFDEPNLNRLVREFSAGENLFLQGSSGNTMYIVLDGTVMLTRRVKNFDRIVGVIGQGEMLGEKAIINANPYSRTLTATAKTRVTAVEFDSGSLKIIQNKMPDFSMKCISLVSERLDRANELISILQAESDVERIIQYIVFFCRHHSKKVAAGIEILMSVEEIAHAVNVPGHRVSETLHVLVTQKHLTKKPNGYVVRNEKELESGIDAIQELLAA